MPVEITLNNAFPAYRPQYITRSPLADKIPATYIVSPPYREDIVVLMDSTPRSSAPSTTTNGYCYYNTTDKMLYVYNNGWKTCSEKLKTRDEGYVYFYYSSSSWYTYKRDSGTMSKIGTMKTWNHIYVKVRSITSSAPLSPSDGDLWYDPSTNYLRAYRNSTWNNILNKNMFSAYSVWIAFNRCLYWYDSTYSTNQLHYCYNSAYLSPDVSSPSTGRVTLLNMGGTTVTKTHDIDWPSDTEKTYTSRVTWYKNSTPADGEEQYVPEQNSYYEDCTYPETIQGRRGNLNASVTVTSTLPAYVQEGDEVTFRFKCEPNSSYKASVLVPKTAFSNYQCEQFGVHWLIALGGAPMIGNTLENAVATGIVSVSRINTSGYNISEVSLKLLKGSSYGTLHPVYITAYTQHSNSSGAITDTYTQLATPIIVYGKSTPTISATVNPASADPEVYPPPYIVDLQDTTPVSQVPVTSVTMDAGDSQDPESWTSSSHFSSTDIKTHTYNGYGAYRPSITVVDANGNTSVGYASFAPNKTARVYANSKITYNGTDYAPESTITGGNAPILLTCNAFVAGSPLPDVKWSYALQSATTDYYTGEKEGAFAELSLLADGNYDIYCKITSGNTVLRNDHWTVSAVPVVIAETPVAMQDFVVWVYDENGARIDRIVPTSAQYTDRFSHASYCEFTVPMDYAHIDRLIPGRELAFGYLGKARLMIVTGFDEDADSETVKITATDAASYSLQSRVATVATRSTSGNGYDVQTCSAEALLRYFAVSNILTGNRQIPELQVVGTCTDAGGKTTYSARYEDILTIFEDICSSSGLGWDSALQSATQNTFSLKVINPVDRSYNDTSGGIVFEDRKNGRGSATIGSYSGFVGANLAIAAGKGNGSSREYYEFTWNNYRAVVPQDTATYPLKVSDGSHRTIAGNTYVACRETSTDVLGYFCVATQHWVPIPEMTGYDLELVDKLIFTGTQKIDTGFTPNQNTSFKMTYKANSLIRQTIFGAYGSEWDTNNYGVYYNNTGSAWGNYNSDTRFTPTPYVDSEHTVYQNKRKLYVDGVLKLTHSSTTFTSSTTLKLGRCDGILESNGYKFSGYIKYAQIWNGSTLVRDMIPIKYGTTYAMLDKLNWVVYTNVGTGALTGGDVTGYIQYADHVEGLGRYEVFVDAGDSANNLEMQRQAEVELAKQDERTLVVYPNESVYRLGVDYNVGDYVTVRTKSGIILNLQIIEANYAFDETGKQLSLECGTDLRDYQRLIREGQLANTYARK